MCVCDSLYYKMKIKNSAHVLVFASILAIFFLILLSSPASAVFLRTQTFWIASSKDGVDVIPYVRADKKVLFVDFEDKDFSNIKYIYYARYNTNKTKYLKTSFFT